MEEGGGREVGSRRKVKMLSITEIMSHALQDDQPERIQHYRGGISPILGFGNQKNKNYSLPLTKLKLYDDVKTILIQ